VKTVSDYQLFLEIVSQKENGSLISGCIHICSYFNKNFENAAGSMMQKIEVLCSRSV
jgi:hypothetical protein